MAEPNLLDFLMRKPAPTFDAPSRPPDDLLDFGGMPSGPQRLGQRELAKIAAAAAAVLAVREVNIDADCIPLAFNIATAGLAGAFEALTAPPRTRNLLIVRNSASSAGIVFIGLGAAQLDAGAVLALPAGQQAIFDRAVPQNNVWLTTDVAPTLGVVTYALAPFT